MEPEHEYAFENLAKEIVLQKLKGVENPEEQTGQIVLEIAVPAVTSTRGRQDPHTTVTATCRGIMQGMILLEGDLSRTAVSLLGQVAMLAQEAELDPAECMTWAMEGMATVCRMAPNPVRSAISTAIEDNFMGAGEVFNKLVGEAAPPT